MIPEGYRLVPEELTGDMKAAMVLALTPETQWAAALKTAPRPPVMESSELVKRLRDNYIEWQNGRKPKRDSGPDWTRAADTLESQENELAALRDQVRALMDATR